MKLTSEQFGEELMKDIEAPKTTPSFAEQLAQMEQRINDRIKSTEESIFSKVDELTAKAETTPVEVTEVEPENEVEITTVIEEEKGE